jgi:predicted RNase H-like HicB family nuclease
MRNVLLYTDEDGNWIADVPSLPGCHSDGKTREEAIERVKEAIEVYIEALEQDNLPVLEEYENVELTHACF